MDDKAGGPDAPTLFALPPAVPLAPADPKRGARLREANRARLAWGRIDLDAQRPDDHPARAICAVIERLDLSALYAPIEARDAVAGAPAIAPKLLLVGIRHQRGRGQRAGDLAADAAARGVSAAPCGRRCPSGTRGQCRP